MKSLKFIWILICMHGGMLFANSEDLILLDFEWFLGEKGDAVHQTELLALEGEKVQIRGFWYPLTDHEGILSPQINLKSCCIKAPDKIHHQLLVKGNEVFPNEQRALTVDGIFKIAPLYNAEGQLQQLFVLDQAKMISQSHGYSYWIVLSSLFFIMGFISFLLKRRKELIR